MLTANITLDNQMLAALEGPVTLVLIMKMRVFGGRWAMVLRPFGPECGGILQVENSTFLSVQNQLVTLTYKLQVGC